MCSWNNYSKDNAGLLKNSRYKILCEEIQGCKKCFPVEKKRVLLGHGSLNAKIMCIGEAPSIDVEGPGRVFGRLSRPIYEEFLKWIDVKEEDIWTTNVVKCTIPHEAVGNPDKCKAFLLKAGMYMKLWTR